MDNPVHFETLTFHAGVCLTLQYSRIIIPFYSRLIIPLYFRIIIPLNLRIMIPLYSWIIMIPLYSWIIIIPLYFRIIIPLYSRITPLYYRIIIPLYSRIIIPLYSRIIIPLYSRIIIPLYSRIIIPLYPRIIIPLYSRIIIPLYSRIIIPYKIEGARLSTVDILVEKDGHELEVGNEIQMRVMVRFYLLHAERKCCCNFKCQLKRCITCWQLYIPLNLHLIINVRTSPFFNAVKMINSDNFQFFALVLDQTAV